MIFTARIGIRGVNPCVLVVARRAAALKPGWRAPMPVRIRVDGRKGGRVNLMPAGNGDFYLYLRGDIRRSSGTKVGDRVTIEIAFDAARRPTAPMPAWFREGLARHPEARANWEKLIPSRKKDMLRTFGRLKSPEARERNLTKALHVLSGNSGRFLARDWRDGR